MPEREVDTDTDAALDLVHAIAEFTGEQPAAILFTALAQDGVPTGTEPATPEAAPNGAGVAVSPSRRRIREVDPDVARWLDVLAVAAKATGEAPGSALRSRVRLLLIPNVAEPTYPVPGAPKTPSP